MTLIFNRTRKNVQSERSEDFKKLDRRSNLKKQINTEGPILIDVPMNNTLRGGSMNTKFHFYLRKY